VRQLRKGTLSFTYSPKFDRYDKFQELDNTGHYLDLSLNVTPTPISRVTLSTSYSRTQDQGDPTDPNGEIFIGRRTQRERASLGLSYRNRLGGRFLWGFGAQFLDSSFKDIADFDPGGAQPIAGRQTLRGSLDLLRNLSRATNLGVRLGYGKFRLDQGTDGDSRELGLILEHALSGKTDFAMGLGAYQRDNAAPQNPGGSGDTRTGIQGFTNLRRQFRKATLSLDAKRSTSDGGISPGTSTDSSLGVSVSGAADRRWNWSFNTRFGRREPTDEQLDSIDTVAIGLGLGVRLHRKLYLRLSPVYTHQVGNDQGVDSLVLRGGLGFAWAPLEKTRLGGRG
jgi:hypothetical protein